MAEVGKINKLKIIRSVDFGVYLDGEELGEILLPQKYVPEGFFGGDEIEVIVYFDSEDRIIATTEKPLAEVGQFAFLECVAITKVGAFLNWGLQKDLLVPFREQRHKLEEGKSYVVYVYLDHTTNRIVASAKVDKFLDNLPVEFEEGEEVDLLIYGISEIGYKAIVDEVSSGILYKNEVFKPVKVGEQLKGYIKKVREDDKIDLTLYKPGYQKLDEFSEQIVEYLKANDGIMDITDKSSPDEIYSTFGISKKNFKKAIGGLYKQRIIIIDNESIRLVGEQ
ncbi:MAG: GntR family transcriptional regulator [Prolixibacteraceae bacterium]|nr:GntR family transcriptional regulator [Prolixibacteraceae bacterium]